MRYLAPALLILALPAGVVGYMVGAWLVSLLPVPAGLSGIVQLFVPLLLGGLCMVPFVIPALDRMAKRDLAALERQRAADAAATPKAEPPAKRRR